MNSGHTDSPARNPSMESERPLRSLAKAVSWRVTGSIDTLLLSWWLTGDLAIAAAIGSAEVLTKTVLYYVHERVWNRIRPCRGEATAVAEGCRQDRPAPADRLETVAPSCGGGAR